MLQVIDRDYIQAILDLPDGVDRLDRWIGSMIDDRDTAQAIAKACVEQIEPLRRQRDDLRAALNHELQVRRDQRIELQAEIDAAYAELESYREGRR